MKSQDRPTIAPDAAMAEPQGAAARMATVLESVLDVYYAVDWEWRLTTVNPAAERVYFRRPATELLGKVLWEEYPQLRDEAAVGRFRNVASGGTPRHSEVKSPAVDLWFEEHVFPRDGGVEVYLREITGRKEIELALQRLAQFPEENPNPVMRVAADGTLLYANAAARDWLPALSWQVDGPLPGSLLLLVAEARKSGRPPAEVELCGPVGPVYSLAAVQPKGEDYVNIYGRDTTASKRAESLRRESAELYNVIFERTTNVILVVDTAGCLVDCNEPAARLMERSHGTLQGQPLRDLLVAAPSHGDKDSAAVLREAEREVELACLCGGQTHVLDFVVIRLSRHGQEQLLAVGKDVTGYKQVESALRREALHDRLTGLPNRVLFMEELENRLRRALRHAADHFAVMFIDLDGFKAVNDRHGHLAGDRLLVDFGARLRQVVREGDVVARYAGDEFVVLVDGVRADRDVVVSADRILAALMPPFDVAGQPTPIRASIGIARYTGTHQSASQLVKEADAAMYRAKSKGGSQYAIFDPETRAAAANLRDAILRRRLTLQYQPVVAVATGRVVSLEALLRWPRPSGGVAYPPEVLELVEQLGMERELTRWVMRQACQQAGAWTELTSRSTPACISVNMPLRLLAEPGIADDVGVALGNRDAGHCLLGLEITEDGQGVWDATVIENLRRLRGLGVTLAVDGFGVGQLSLDVLQRLPVGVLKIDHTLIGALGSTPDAAKVVRGIVALADSLGMDAVAKGVETQVQLDALRAAGCRMAQGFLFARPLSPGDAHRFLVAAA